MKYFLDLPLLDMIVKQAALRTSLWFRENHVAVIGVQHLLETTGTLVESLCDLGINANSIFLLGKSYSTHTESVEKLRELDVNVFDNRPYTPGNYAQSFSEDIEAMLVEFKSRLKKGTTVIVLDDGGYLLGKIMQDKKLIERHRVFGVEQTTSGIRMFPGYEQISIVNVAGSAVKRFLEPNLIAEAFWEKNADVLDKDIEAKVGVIGFGSIGEALARFLTFRGKQVLVYDKHTPKEASVSYHTTLPDLVSQCDIVIGASGFDVFDGIAFDTLINGDKIFLSASSGEIEFFSLLRAFQPIASEVAREGSLPDLRFRVSNFNLVLRRGGTPANFDNGASSVASVKIQLTRALLLAGVIQIAEDTERLYRIKQNVMLDSAWQAFSTFEWFNLYPDFARIYNPELIAEFRNVSNIEKMSSGKIP